MKQLPDGFGLWGLKRQLQWLSSLPEFRESPEAQALAVELTQMAEQNPLLVFEPHSDPQREFIDSTTPIVAAFAGNRFGKSTALVVCALRELLGSEFLPPWLRASRRFDAPVDGWIVCPTDDKIYDSMMPALRKWCPQEALKGGNFDKGWNGARNILSFKNGSSLAFKTYKQDPSTLGGAELRFVGYDEPPPKDHREESRMRLMGGGFEMFAMTPLKANTGYVRKAIWKKREAPHITVVKGSIHDNPTLDKRMIQEALGDMTDLWRKAREFGDFVDVGGQIFPDFERCVAREPLDLEFIRTLDVVVGIDPGIRNAGFAWVGFDRDWTAYVFNEGLLQDREVHEYAEFILEENKRLGLSPKRVSYVSDPMQRERGKVNSETVATALRKHGIFASDGQNSHEAGFDQMRSRMRHSRFVVDPRCRGLRDEADDYAAKEPGEFDDDSHLVPVSNQFHRMDALRYAVMERFFDAYAEEAQKDRGLGWSPASGTAPPAHLVLTDPRRDYGPLGSCA